MNKNISVMMVIVIIIVISVSLGVFCFIKPSEHFNFAGAESRNALLKQVSDQAIINEKLNGIADEKKYTFTDAYVELNPYKISPLSAVIIFNTNKDEEVDVYINDKFATKIQATSRHIIPVYGLYEDFDNKVRLVMNGEEKTYSIRTKKSNIAYPLNVEYKQEGFYTDELYFTVASYKTYFTGWDIDGKLRFYLTVDNRMDVEWLPNGHFLIGVAEGQFAENFASFVEMDYLGKIYNYYVPSNGYSFEFQVLSDGNYMLAGGDKPVYIDEQVIYSVNKDTGETMDILNIANIIKSIDPEFDGSFLGQKAIRNSFYYDEAQDNLVVSLRGWNAVLSFSYKNKTLNWVFTNPENELFAHDIWRNYLVVSSSGNYPLGQHSVFITPDGNLGLFNNGYDRLHGFENNGNDLVSYYKDNFSSADVYRIINKQADLVWRYDENRSMFSHQYGSFRELNNGNYLIDFGYNLKDEYRLGESGKLSLAEANPDNIYATILEVDKSQNVLFKARSEEGKYRAFKNSLYSPTMPNLDVSVLNIHNNLEKSSLMESNSKQINLNNAREWIYTSEFTRNTFTTNYDIKDDDVIDLFFVTENGKIFIFNYKDSDTKRQIFNVDLESGKYALYVKLNDLLYKTNMVIVF